MKYLAYSVEDFITDITFVNYLERINEQDVAFWENILKTYPEIVKKANEAKELYLLLSAKRDISERQSQLNRLKLTIEALEEPKIKQEEDEPRTIKYRKPYYWLVAATFLIFFGIGAAFFKLKLPNDIAAFAASENYYQVIEETKFGERKTVNLPDGSSVILNGGSILSIAKNYNQKERVVKLTGEAFFEVAKDKSKPFMVLANNTITRALGTSFKIKNYLDNQELSIALATGKVSIKEIHNTKEVLKEEILAPGEELKVYSHKPSEKVAFDQQSIIDWKEKNISFSMATLNEIKDKLNEMYGILIITTNTSANKNFAFTGTFKGQDLKDVLDAISFVNNFDYKIDEKKVFITFK